MVGIHEIFTATTIIGGLWKGKLRNTATGFFFSKNGKDVYLVTNKHVIYGDEYNRNPNPIIDQIRLNLHTNVNDLHQNEEVTIDLFDRDNRKWLEHSYPSVDLVAIPVSLNRTKYVFLAIDKTYLDSENIIIYFEKIFVMGYPSGWYDTANNLPITRVGNLSSPFRVPFLNEPYMLGDVETHPGMSGGPVLMDLKDYTVRQDNGSFMAYPGRRKFLLVGVYSGQARLPDVDVRPNLITIWFPELILQIIEAES